MLAQYDREKVIEAASVAAGVYAASYDAKEPVRLEGIEKEAARRKRDLATDIGLGALYATGETVSLNLDEVRLLQPHWPHQEGETDGEG